MSDRSRRIHRTGVLACAAALLLACSTQATEPEKDPDADFHVLFVGNSLTYTNVLPELVQTAAEAAGHSLATYMVAFPNFSLEDHWRAGVAEAIRALRPDVVVLQQGPSSLPANQIYLREWTDTLSRVIEEIGARTALLMVWPDRSRIDFFDDVRDSYRNAALAVDGMFVPAGQSWVEAWERDPTLALYGPDDFHPSRLGSQVAALTVFRVLYDTPLASLPDRMVPVNERLPTIDLGEAAPTVKAAVEAAVAAWAVR